MQYIKRAARSYHKPDASALHAHGEVPKVGDIFVQADLARTVREIVNAEKQGSRRTRDPRSVIWPHGRARLLLPWSRGALGDYMQKNGGLIAAEDLARFHAKLAHP